MNTASQTLPIILNLIAAVLGAFGQWLYKVGASRLSLVPIYKNWQLFAGMIIFCVVMLLFIYAFKIGGRLSVVYPVYATTFIWGLWIAIRFEGEPWNIPQLLGILMIVLGVSMIAFFKPS